ncbi:cytochrome b5 domain-containing protein [Clostridium uliginosum]|uniref:Predicted heme/steroid binding protein n=1 Tax=Clostridium uliginosum TaxID=119641 RepID=A0A1I1JT01_9CLOT|nr:cytochrome b5 domain-containing protein [Clostridium uliginosum]SFC51704.1 Predicted heme/steroid binding protein [Clostridium uliginosum]
MSIYFDVKTIRELIGDNYCRQPKEFTLKELSQYDGSAGKPAYVAIEGIVYDLSKKAIWGGGTHFGLKAGKDLTKQFRSCHEMNKILSKLPKVGILREQL